IGKPRYCRFRHSGSLGQLRVAQVLFSWTKTTQYLQAPSQSVDELPIFICRVIAKGLNLIFHVSTPLMSVAGTRALRQTARMLAYSISNCQYKCGIKVRVAEQIKQCLFSQL